MLDRFWGLSGGADVARLLVPLLIGAVCGALAVMAINRRQRRQATPAIDDTATLQAEYARDDAMALLRQRYEAGEIDLATYEREVDAVRRQSAA